jgi:iron complex outermembrane receptor protein
LPFCFYVREIVGVNKKNVSTLRIKLQSTVIFSLLSGSSFMALAEDADQLPSVTVSAPRISSGYATDAAADTAKSDLPLKDYPASIQVVPAEVLKDRGVTRIDQLVETVSGVHAESNYGGNGATFFNIRGFSESNGLRDGFRNYGYYAFRDVQSIDQVDVFKGPAGALYGGIGAVGGYIDTVSKHPGRENFGEIGVTVGTSGLARTTVDLNRALDNDLSVRLNAAVEHGSGYRDNTAYDSWSVAPAIRWDDRRGTSITLLTEFNHLRRDGFDAGIPAVANYQELSRTRYYGLLNGTYPGVSGDYGKNDTQAATLLFEHALSDQWKLRMSMQYVNARQLSTQSFPNSTTATGNLLDYSVYGDSNEASRQYDVRAELAGDLVVAGLKHKVLAGVDYGYLELGSRGSTVSTMTLDLFNSSYVSGLTASDPLQSHQGRGKDYGLYVMDQVTLTPQVKLMAALRADRFVNEALQSDVVVGRGQQSALSPRVGVVWQPWSETSFFTDWSRSHAPNVGHSGSNVTYDAEVAEQIEVGVKQELVKDRLMGTVALFNLNRKNILTTDPTNPLLQVLSGEQRSRGIEVDVSGTIASGWQAIASYAYTQAIVRADTSIPVGDTLTNVPRHSASLWSTYEFQSVPGLKAGAGVYVMGAREATLPNTFKLAGYARTDLMLGYQRGPWKTQLNIFNLFNRRYYTGGSASNFNYTLTPSRPLSAQVSVSYRFGS